MEPALARTRPSPDGSAARPIRVMIVDDSMVARAVLSRMVETVGGFEIAAVAASAEDAIDALQAVQVDVILLDLEMPGAGGLVALPRMIEVARGARILIVSSLAEEGAEETVAALAMGATDTLPKPGTGRFNGRFSEILVGKLRALGEAQPLRPKMVKTSVSTRFAAPLRAMATGDVGLVAIGASTGGIHALNALFGALPPRIGVPILVTQHLPALFMPVFARQLATVSGRNAEVAQSGMALTPDVILIAPGDAHLTIEMIGGRAMVRLDRRPAASGCLPSLDPMFASVGAAYGRRALGIVLSGMGRDGVEGAERLVSWGGAIIAQDEASSAVWGMPRAVTEAGFACAVMDPANIARRIAARVGDAAWK